MSDVLISVILGDKFTDLLRKLPDGFFKLDKIQQSYIWKMILHELNHMEGEPDLDKLAGLALIWI